MGEARVETGGRRARGTGPVIVRRVGESAWILHPTKALADDVVDALRDVFLEAVDDGAENVVVDLTRVGAVTRRGAATIRAMTDLMRGRNGTLWLAARRSDAGGYRLRALGAEGRSASVGASTALDSALRELATREGRSSETFTRRGSRRHRSGSAAQTPLQACLRSEKREKAPSSTKES